MGQWNNQCRSDDRDGWRSDIHLYRMWNDKNRSDSQIRYFGNDAGSNSAANVDEYAGYNTG